MNESPRGIQSDAPVSRSLVMRDVVSPVTEQAIARVFLHGREDITRLLKTLPEAPPSLPPAEVFAFLDRLRAVLELHRDELCRLTLLETGFITQDCGDTIDGTIDFLAGFESYCHNLPYSSPVIPHSCSGDSSRSMRILHRPLAGVAAVVPQNASLSLAVIVLASALHAGTRAFIRPSLQCAASGEMFAHLIAQSQPPEGSVLVINSLASDFLDACCASNRVDLVHYIGSNQYAFPVLTQAFQARKLCLLDGQGNGLLYIDGSFPLEEAIPLITGGVTRFNGETCTSVNGILVEESLYPKLRDGLVSAFNALRIGDPGDPGVQIGPLFSESQAEGLEASLAKTRLLCGGRRDKAWFAPALVEGVEPGQALVREGVNGPAAWIAPIVERDLFSWIGSNAFPLSDTILSRRMDLVEEFAMRSPAARICVNGDPSVESMFEPWGGYPPSGLNAVSVWTDKYRRSFQLDGPRRLAAFDFPPGKKAA